MDTYIKDKMKYKTCSAKALQRVMVLNIDILPLYLPNDVYLFVRLKKKTLFTKQDI